MWKKLALVMFFMGIVFSSKIYAKDGVVINEIRPGSVEYITLFNNSSTAQDISGWKLYDSSATTTTCNKNTTARAIIPANTILPADSFVQITTANTTLGDQKDRVFLLNGANIVDSWGYGSISCETDDPAYPPVAVSRLVQSTSDIIKRVPDGADDIQVITNISPTLTPSPTMSPSPFPTPTPTPTLPLVDYVSWGIRINEVYSSPNIGEKEWVELYNSDTIDHDMTDWTIDDTKSTSSICKKVGANLIQAKSYLVVECTSSVLNNTGDDAFLISPDQKNIDHLVFPSLKSSQSWSLIENHWQIGIPTPNEVNKVGQVLAESTLSIQEAKKQSDGTTVIILGSVIAEPNLLLKNVFYVEDFSGGIRIDGNNIPILHNNELVKITGKISQIRNERRIEFDSIQIISTENLIKSKKVDLSQITTDLVGNLITVSGEVSETSGSTFVLGEGPDSLTINISSYTGIKKPYTRIGYFAKVSGILTQYGIKDGLPYYRLMPRYQADISIGKTLADTGSGLTEITFLFGVFILFILILLNTRVLIELLTAILNKMRINLLIIILYVEFVVSSKIRTLSGSLAFEEF